MSAVTHISHQFWNPKLPDVINRLVNYFLEKIRELFGYVDPSFKIVMNGRVCDVRVFMCKLLRNGGYRNPITQSEVFTLNEYQPVFDWLNRQPRNIGFLDEVDQRVVNLVLSKNQLRYYKSIHQRPPIHTPFPFEAKVNRNRFFSIWKGSEYMYYPKFISLMIRMRIAPEIILSFEEAFRKNNP
jgi:hypothetical protein